MKKMLLCLLVSWQFVCAIAQAPATPDKIYGDLFRDVQLSKVFPDGKTFVDCIPKRNPKNIVADYHHQPDGDCSDCIVYGTGMAVGGFWLLALADI